MLILITGLILFLLPHLSRELRFRQPWQAMMPGQSAYLGVYSLIALLGLVLIAWGKSRAPFVMIWDPPFAQRYISVVLMIPAAILFVAGNLPMSSIRWQLHNPMLAGVFLWGLAHLWANGDLASILLFGSFTLWSAVKFVSLWKVKQPTDNFRFNWLVRDGGAILGGSLLYLLIYLSHGQLFGVGLAIG